MTTWINSAIANKHLQLYPYNDFCNIEYNGNSGGEGRFGRVASADWPITNSKVALKKLKKYDVDRFISEVNYFITSL
jgi:hypothetical protein